MTPRYKNTRVESKNAILFATLSSIFGNKMNLARIKFFGLFICALCKVQTVCFEKLATAFDTDVKMDSSLRRIQRFIAEYVYKLTPDQPTFFPGINLRKHHGSFAISGLFHIFFSAKLNPLINACNMGLVASALPISIEQFVFQHRFSIVAGGSIIYNSSGAGDSYYHKGGFTVNPELRYYLNNDPANIAKTYAGAWYSYEEHTNGSNDRLGNLVKGKVYGKGAGLLFGNQWFFKNRFLVDIYFGPGYLNYSKNENYDLNVSKGGFLVSITDPKHSGAKIRFGFSVGLAF